MESGYMYYLTDKNIQLERARRQQEAALGILRTVRSPPLSPLASRKDSVLSGMDDEITPFKDLEPEPEAQEMYDYRDGRPYLKDAIYPMPCDLREIHRQHLKSMLSEAVFNGPTRTLFSSGLPREVLEVGCGSGYWTARCHDHFKDLGHEDVSFTGMDVVSIAPDFRKQGINWTFVHHDARRFPWPFLDGSFDYIMLKDLLLAFPLESLLPFVVECARLLSENGTLEIRDTNPGIRCLVSREQALTADPLSKVYALTPTVTFGSTQNSFLQESNAWIKQECESRRLTTVPVDNVDDRLTAMSHLFHELVGRRVAIPLAKLPAQLAEDLRLGSKSDEQKGKAKIKGEETLTADQAAIRKTALLIVVQQIEAWLKPASGKTNEEWSVWLTDMMSSLLLNNGAGNGECLEMGAWWITKKKKPNERLTKS